MMVIGADPKDGVGAATYEGVGAATGVEIGAAIVAVEVTTEDEVEVVWLEAVVVAGWLDWVAPTPPSTLVAYTRLDVSKLATGLRGSIPLSTGSLLK